MKKLLLIVALTVFALAVVACSDDEPAPVRTTQVTVPTAQPVPPAATSKSSQVTPPSKTETSAPVPGTFGPTKLQPVPQPAPSPFVVPATPPAKVYNLPGTPEITIKEFRNDLPTSARLMVFLPALATADVMEGPSPLVKVATVITIAGIGTFYLAEHRDDIAKAATLVFEGTRAEVLKWSQSFQSERVRSAASLDLSVNHQESKGVILNLQGMTVNGKLSQSGDGRSNGSIRIFFGSDQDPQVGTPRANFAILYVFGSHIKFAVVSAPLLDQGGNGLQRIPTTGKFYDPKALAWTCAWILADHVGNGSKKLFPPENTWLSVGEGWAAWGVISQRYNLIVPIFEVPLPPMPPGL